MHVNIVGAGIYGLTIAWALLRAGCQVAVFDQGAIPNPLGASVDQHRLIHPFAAPHGSPNAFTAWDQLWEDLSAPWVARTGAVFFATSQSRRANEVRAKLADRSVPHRIIDGSVLQRRFPQLVLPRGAWALAVEDGGVLLADRIIASMHGWILRKGGICSPNRRVVAINPDRAQIRFADGTLASADRLVLAAGAWTPRLVADFAEGLVVYRQVMVYLGVPDRWREIWQSCPAIVDFGAADERWLAPPVLGTTLKIAVGPHRRPGDPERAQDRSVTPEEIEVIVDRFRQFFHEDDHYELLRAVACFYATPADGRLIIEPLDAARRSWIVTGCSGSGFKSAPGVALELARRVMAEV